MTTASLTEPRMPARARLANAGRRAGRRLAAIRQAGRPVLANLARVPLTAAGLGCVDVGVFRASEVAGWIVTGVSLMVLEHLIADED